MNVDVRPDRLDLLSICSGGAGLDLGIELAIPCARAVCMVEREAFAITHLVSAMEKGLLAPAPIWSNARTFDGRPWRGSVDGLIGGIPCQPHSLAGKKRGKLDPRDLWSPTRRVIVQARPWFVLIENVAGMLSPGHDKISGAERVWRDLQKLGFAVEGGLFTAAEVGAPHERERIFILGVANAIGRVSDGRRSRNFPGSGSSAEGKASWEDWQRSGDDPGDSGERLADTDSERLEGERPDVGAKRRSDARGSTGLRSRAIVVDPNGSRRQAPGTRHSFDSTKQSQSRCIPLVDARSDGRGEGKPKSEAPKRNRFAADGASPPVDDPARGERYLHPRPRSDRIGETDARGASEGFALFPPGPSDFDSWRGILAHSPDLEPAVRRMADGVAARVDLSGPHAARVDRLRMLGNGVVSLEGAHAFRTLVHRLADQGSAGAARLIRMMVQP